MSNDENDDSISTKIKQLEQRQTDLTTGHSLYFNIIDRLKYQKTTEELGRLIDHQKGLLEEANHIDFKVESEKCLKCPKLMFCPKKCKDA